MIRWTALLLLPCAACSGGAANDAALEEPGDDGATTSGASIDLAGGSTEDFTGDMEVCTTTSSFELGEATPLGYSGADVLVNAAGEFAVPIRWISLCQQSDLPCSRSTFCEGDSPERPMSVFAGTETLVSIQIQARESPVRVTHRTPGDEHCAEFMSIPVSLRVQTADSALDETVDATLGSDTPDLSQSIVGLSRSVSALQGGLAEDSAFPGDALFQMVFGFYSDKVWMEMDVVRPGSESTLPLPLLSDMLPPFDRCALDVPRADVER